MIFKSVSELKISHDHCYFFFFIHRCFSCMNTKTPHSLLVKGAGIYLLFFSCRIQSSYAALQRINQDLEDKMHRTVRDSQSRSNLIMLRCCFFQPTNRSQGTFCNVHTPQNHFFPSTTSKCFYCFLTDRATLPAFGWGLTRRPGPSAPSAIFITARRKI